MGYRIVGERRDDVLFLSCRDTEANLLGNVSINIAIVYETRINVNNHEYVSRLYFPKSNYFNSHAIPF